MLQRIQTIYWLLAVITIGVWFFLPYATIEAAAGLLTLTPTGLRNAAESELLFTGWATILIGVLTAALLFVAIVSYRRTTRQIRISILACLLLLGTLGLEAYYIYAATSTAKGVWQPHLALWLPLLAAVLAWLGLRGVRKDVDFIRRMDRLR